MSSQLQDALGMFAFLAIELSVLFIGISLLVGVLQRHIPPSKVEALLTSSGKRGGRVRQGGVISAVAVGHRQAALAVMCRG